MAFTPTLYKFPKYCYHFKVVLEKKYIRIKKSESSTHSISGAYLIDFALQNYVHVQSGSKHYLLVHLVAVITTGFIIDYSSPFLCFLFLLDIMTQAVCDRLCFTCLIKYLRAFQVNDLNLSLNAQKEIFFCLNFETSSRKVQSCHLCKAEMFCIKWLDKSQWL